MDGGREPRGAGPEFSARTIRYECAARVSAIPCGGIGAMHMLACAVGLVDAIEKDGPQSVLCELGPNIGSGPNSAAPLRFFRMLGAAGFVEQKFSQRQDFVFGIE